MKGKVIYARKTNGGRCCSFKHKSTTTNGQRHASKPAREEEQETAVQQLTGTSIKSVTNPHIPSNQQVQAKKPKMDAFARKLESVKLKKRNITFSL